MLHSKLFMLNRVDFHFEAFAFRCELIASQMERAFVVSYKGNLLKSSPPIYTWPNGIMQNLTKPPKIHQAESMLEYDVVK